MKDLFCINYIPKILFINVIHKYALVVSVPSKTGTYHSTENWKPPLFQWEFFEILIPFHGKTGISGIEMTPYMWKNKGISDWKDPFSQKNKGIKVSTHPFFV